MLFKKKNKEEEQTEEKLIDKFRSISFVFYESNGLNMISVYNSLNDEENKEFIQMCAWPDQLVNLIYNQLKQDDREEFAKELEALYLKRLNEIGEEAAKKLFDKITVNKKIKNENKTKAAMKVLLNEDLNIENHLIDKEDIKNPTIIWEDLSIETDIIDGIIKESEDIDDDEFDSQMLEQEEIITSPFGVFKLKDFFNPMGQYNWFMGHVNFTLTQDIIRDLCRITGVEKILILSRYRFLVAFGKVFEDKEVKKNIQTFFGATPPLSEEAIAKAKDLSQLYDRWAIYFINDDNWWYADDTNYDEKLIEFRKNQKDLGGLVVTHED